VFINFELVKRSQDGCGVILEDLAAI